MKQFTITYPQLMNQAIDQRFSMRYLAQLAKTHHFAVKLSGGIEYRMGTYSTRCAELAERLGAPKLAEYLSTISSPYADIELPVEVVCEQQAGYDLPSRRLWQANLLECYLMKCIRMLKRFKSKG